MRLTQTECVQSKPDDRYARNIKDDMLTALNLLFEFKEGMDKLHPECSAIVERLLENPNRVNRY